MDGGYEIGSGLRQVLEARGCALSAAEARALSIRLIDLIASGLLVAEAPGAVHGDGVVAEPSTDGTPREPAGLARGADRPGGGRVAFDGGGAVVSVSGLQTAPAYNMGQSVCIPEVQE